MTMSRQCFLRAFSACVAGGMLLMSFVLDVHAEEPRRQQGDTVELTLADSVMLALRTNRTIQIANLDRVVQKFALRVAQDRFQPHGTLAASTRYERVGTESGRSSAVIGEILPRFTLLMPTGAQMVFTWATTGTNRTTVINGVDSTVGTSSGALSGNALAPGDTSQTALFRSRSQLGQTSTAGEGGTFANSVELTFQQPLLKGGGVAVNTAPVHIARLTEQNNIFALKATLINTITSTILAYRRLLQAQLELNISQISLQRAQALLEVNKTLISLGRLAKLEIAQAETDVASRELDVVTAQSSVDSARLALISFLDIPADTLLVAVEPLRIEPVTLELGRLLAVALQNRPDYLASLLQINIAGLNRLVAKNNRLWDLSLEGGYSLAGIDKKFTGAFKGLGERPKDNWQVGLTLTVPLHDLTLDQAVVNTRIATEQAQVRVEESRHQVDIEVQDGVRNVLVSLQQAELAQRVRELSEKQLAVEREKLQGGRSSNFQLITLQNNLAAAQVRELAAALTYLNAQTLLDQILGTTLETWHIDASLP